MKIAVLALLVSCLSVVHASSASLSRFAPTIAGAQCTLGKGCVVPAGQDVVCSYDLRQERESLKSYVEEVTNEKLSAQEEENLVRALGHYTRFKLKLKDSNRVIQELKLKKPFESDNKTQQVQVQSEGEQLEETDYHEGWSVHMSSNQRDTSKTYLCCLEVNIDEKYVRKPQDFDDQYIKICTRIKFEEKEESAEDVIQAGQDQQENSTAYRKLEHLFTDLTNSVRTEKAKHSDYFVPLVLATVAMVVLVALSTVFCIVTVIFEVCCNPRPSRRHHQRQKLANKNVTVVNEDSFLFDDHPDFSTSAKAINLPCTITEYLRQIESSPTTSVINIRQQQEIAPPSYMDIVRPSGRTNENDDNSFNLTMKF